jgi:hypothetical protein
VAYNRKEHVEVVVRKEEGSIDKEPGSADIRDAEQLHNALQGKQHSYLYTLGMFRETYCTNKQMCVYTSSIDRA